MSVFCVDVLVVVLVEGKISDGKISPFRGSLKYVFYSQFFFVVLVTPVPKAEKKSHTKVKTLKCIYVSISLADIARKPKKLVAMAALCLEATVSIWVLAGARDQYTAGRNSQGKRGCTYSEKCRSCGLCRIP